MSLTGESVVLVSEAAPMYRRLLNCHIQALMDALLCLDLWHLPENNYRGYRW